MLDFLVLVKLLVLRQAFATADHNGHMVGTLLDSVRPSLGSWLDPFQGPALIDLSFFNHQVALFDLGSFVLSLPVSDG